MGFLKQLWQSELLGLAALLICACAMAVYGFAESYLWSLKGANLIIPPKSAAMLVFLYSGSIGLVAVLFYGAPAYAFLCHKRIAYWWTAFLVGVAPGSLIIFVEQELGAWLTIGGATVASILHFLRTRFVSNDPAL